MESTHPLSKPALAATACAGAAALALALMAAPRAGVPAAAPYRSPSDVAFSPDGRTLAVSDRTAGEVVLLDAAGQVTCRVRLKEPAGLAWDPRHDRLYAADTAGDAVVRIDARTGRTERRIAVAPRPAGVAVAPNRGLLVAACAGLHSVSVVDLASGRERARIACSGEPYGVAASPDESLAVVGSVTAAGPATDPANSAALAIVDLRTLRLRASVRLPAGSVGVRGVAVSPDGRWAYAAHALGRFNLPTTQLDRGWINTNALSIVDLAARKVYATVLLDQIGRGSADPWGLALSRDGARLWIALSGVHELATIDLARLHRCLAGQLPDDSPLLRMAPEYGPGASSVWAEVRKDPARRSLLADDLTAMQAADLISYTSLSGFGPRGLARSPDGRRLAAAVYFSGTVDMVDTTTGRQCASASLGPTRAPDQARTGERMFHDATLCYQRWLSCSTCHPDGRSDGLNWDLLNDGIGNPKNTRSLLLANRRSPVMSHGVRANYRVATAAGFRFIEFREPQTGEAEAVEAYIASLRPQPSPHLQRAATLSASAKRGKALFDSPKTRCAVCHKGPMLTDQRVHDVGTRAEFDMSAGFLTSPLVEVWRTAPYLHDGSAVTMREVLTKRNRRDRHGVTSHLSRQQVDDLAEYVLSL